MEYFGIVTNLAKDPDGALTREVCDFFAAHGKRCERVAEAADVGERTDCLVVLGGDGTMLRAARDCAGRRIPILGINLGKLGYLAEVERQNWREALTRLLEGSFELERRMMLRGTLTCGRRDAGVPVPVPSSAAGVPVPVSSSAAGVSVPAPNAAGAPACDTTPEYALNDVVITRDGSLQIVNYHIFVNGQFLNTFEADGIIVSTPTGSTAYNLSAGGPIVEPKAKLIVLTPICPHTLSTRSIILAPEDRIAIAIGAGRGGEVQRAKASFDGGFDKPMETGDRIEICRSVREAQIVKLSRQSFLETLHGKMAH